MEKDNLEYVILHLAKAINKELFLRGSEAESNACPARVFFCPKFLCVWHMESHTLIFLILCGFKGLHPTVRGQSANLCLTQDKT